ncbi:hypothetical protein WAE61_10620 [Comamonadaceae bacterium PP-2]
MNQPFRDSSEIFHKWEYSQIYIEVCPSTFSVTKAAVSIQSEPNVLYRTPSRPDLPPTDLSLECERGVVLLATPDWALAKAPFSSGPHEGDAAVYRLGRRMMDKLDVIDAVTADLHHLKAVMTTLSYAFGGECPAEQRPADLQLCLIMQWASKVSERAYHLASKDPSTCGSLAGELMEMSALLHLMDATNLAMDMKIAFNDPIMDGYLDAMVHCADRALAIIDLDNASPGLKKRLAAEEGAAEN